MCVLIGPRQQRLGKVYGKDHRTEKIQNQNCVSGECGGNPFFQAPRRNDSPLSKITIRRECVEKLMAEISGSTVVYTSKIKNTRSHRYIKQPTLGSSLALPGLRQTYTCSDGSSPASNFRLISMSLSSTGSAALLSVILIASQGRNSPCSGCCISKGRTVFGNWYRIGNQSDPIGGMTCSVNYGCSSQV